MDERLRAATVAVTEREHLVRLKSQLGSDVASAELAIKKLALELRQEQSDVDRLSSGVQGFLNDLLGGEQLSREQREVAEVAARLREAIGERDALRTQAASIDDRLAHLTPDALAHELQAARAAKEAAVVAGGGPTGAALLDLDVRLESIDIELIPLQDALSSGHAALAKLAEIVATLDAARDDRETRKHADTTRGLVGDAQARMIGFRRALDDLATSGADPIVDERPAESFADGWIRALLGEGERASRIAAARASISERIDYVRAKLAAVRARHDELAARRTAIVNEREQLLAP